MNRVTIWKKRFALNLNIILGKFAEVQLSKIETFHDQNLIGR